jgi:hypothetical protein
MSEGMTEANKSGFTPINAKFLELYLSFATLTIINVRAILCDDKINDEYIKSLITKIAEEWVVIDTRGYHDDSTLHGAQLFCFFCYKNSSFQRLELVIDNLRNLPDESLVRHGKGHEAEIRAHVDTYRDK